MAPDHENVQAGLAEGQGPAAADIECTGTYRDLCVQLEGASRALRTILSDIDPRFVHTGRELRSVARETRELIETIQTTAGLVSSKAGEGGTLEKSGELIENRIAETG